MIHNPAPRNSEFNSGIGKTRLLDRTGLTKLQHQIVIPFALDFDMGGHTQE